MIHIQKARYEDLPAILSLQKLAYQSEAKLLNDFTIQPLVQTLEEATKEFQMGILLKATNEDLPERIVGSVRGRVTEETLHIGKLIVHPSHQNQGIGTRLLLAMESFYPDLRYELFTSDKSKKNLSLYTKNGYQEFKREVINDILTLVFLEKNVN